MTAKIPVPTLVRLEYLTPQGWVDAGVQNLLYPHRYAERLAERGKVGRATDITDPLKPGKTWDAGNAPTDPSVLEPDPHSPIPRLPGFAPAAPPCQFCGDVHTGPYDGACLL